MTTQLSLSFLVVEDYAYSRQLIVNQLEDLGHQVVGQAANGPDALKATQRLAPDVVLTDLQMPDPETGRDDPQAGIKVARAIQEQCPTPVIVLTAHIDPSLVQAASAAGIGAYLLKPPQAQEITRAATIALARFDDMMALRKALAELRTTQAQLLKHERLAAVGQLAAGIAHEFNNVLSAISLTAQTGLRQPSLPPGVVDKFVTVVAESRRAADLTQQMLDFGRRSMMRTARLDLATLVEQASDELRQSLPPSVRLIVEIKAATPDALMVEADPTQIRRVLINLTHNASDAMPQGGKLRVSVARVDELPPLSPPRGRKGKEATEAGEWICLTVADTGTGITEDVYAHLFEPFFTTRLPERSGLGLAQVYGIVKQHAGHIAVETAVGKGSTFRIYLSAHTRGEKEHTKNVEREIKIERPAPPQEESETILLVEDNEGLRQAGQAVLELLGYRVLTAANGIAALEIMNATPPCTPAGGIDLLITDLMMPRMGGKKLLQELGNINPRLKALAITGYSVWEVSDELQEAGFWDVIRKPFDVDTLARAVRRVLDADEASWD